METNKTKIKTLCISLLAVICIEVAARAVISKGLYPQMAVVGAARFVEIILMILVVLIWGRGLSSIGLAPSKLTRGLKRGLIWSAGFGMLTAAMFAVMYYARINPLTLVKMRLPARPGEVVLLYCVGGLVGPIAEEIFFRGLLYGFFRRWGVLVAVLLSTVIFVLIHPLSPAWGIQAVGGVLFAVAYEVGRSLMVPITIHALGNMAIFTLSMVS